jgi:hypothetical protein
MREFQCATSAKCLFAIFFYICQCADGCQPVAFVKSTGCNFGNTARKLDGNQAG